MKNKKILDKINKPDRRLYTGIDAPLILGIVFITTMIGVILFVFSRIVL